MVLRRRSVVIIAGAAVVLGVVAYSQLRPYLFSTASNTTLSPQEVRNHFLDHVSTTTVQVAVSDAPTETASSVPVVDIGPTLPRFGIYVYDTAGGDSVDALKGQRHIYPATTTITIVPFGCGVLARWDVLKARWQESQRCVVGHSISLSTHTTHDEFFGRGQTDTYECTGDGRPVNVPINASFSYVCTQAGATDVYSGVVVGTESLLVGGITVHTLHVRVSIDSGTPTDSQVTDSWFQIGTDLLIAQVTTNATSNSSVVGVVHYEEQYELHLRSLDPQV